MFHGMFLPDGQPPIFAVAPLWYIRGFEILVLVLFLFAIRHVIRRKEALYTGAFVFATVPMLYWDWIQNQPSQFRLMYDDRFFYAFRMTDGPGFGPGEPWFIMATYALHFVPMAFWIVARDAWLTEKLGRLKWPVLFFAIMPQNFIEIITVQVLKLYKYYMEPEWLTPWGFPYFNFIATPLIICLLAWMILKAKAILALLPAGDAAMAGPGGSSVPRLTAKERDRIAFMFGGASTISAFFLGWCVYHNFYMWSQPWAGGSPWPH